MQIHTRDVAVLLLLLVVVIDVDDVVNEVLQDAHLHPLGKTGHFAGRVQPLLCTCSKPYTMFAVGYTLHDYEHVKLPVNFFTQSALFIS